MNRLLEHYSHLRIDAKRQALDVLDESRRDVHNVGGTSADAEASVDSPAPPKSSIDIPLFVALSDSLTSQSRHSLALAGSPPSASTTLLDPQLDIPQFQHGVQIVRMCDEEVGGENLGDDRPRDR